MQNALFHFSEANLLDDVMMMVMSVCVRVRMSVSLPQNARLAAILRTLDSQLDLCNNKTTNSNAQSSKTNCCCYLKIVYCEYS